MVRVKIAFPRPPRPVNQTEFSLPSDILGDRATIDTNGHPRIAGRPIVARKKTQQHGKKKVML